MADQVLPIRLSERIATLDVLRGIAVCGILLMNIPEMGLIGEMALPAFPARLDADWIAYGVQQTLFDGTMRGLFTLLFGAGMLLMLRRADGPDPTTAPIDVWTRRCLALMALGLVHCAVLLWPGEILWNYGLCGLFLLAFRLTRPRTLLVVAAILLCGLTGYHGVSRLHMITQQELGVQAEVAKAAGTPLDETQTKALAGLQAMRETWHPTANSVAKERAERTRWPAVIGWSWTSWWTYNLGSGGWVALVEGLGSMLIGMALFRLGILTGEATTGTYLRMMVIGYGGGLAMRIVVLVAMAKLGFDLHPERDSVLSYTLRALAHEPSRLLMTFGHLGAIVLVFRAGWLGRAAPLRALGRMALTTYTLQSVIAAVLFYGFGLVGRVGFAGLMAICVPIWIVTGLFSVLWLRSHAMGPVEWLLRRVAYGTARSPAVRVEGEAASAAVPAI